MGRELFGDATSGGDGQGPPTDASQAGGDGQRVDGADIDGALVDGPRDSQGEPKPCVSAADCNDGLSCTDDQCTAAGCKNTLLSGYCLINGACFQDGTKKSGSACARCDVQKTTGAWTDDANLCQDDGLACTTTACAGGACNHLLQSNFCLINNSCLAQGAVDPQNSCRGCDPATSSTSYQPLKDGSGCKSDNLSCTQDICQVGNCTHPLAPKYCLINGACVSLDAKDPLNECKLCNPSVSTKSYSDVKYGTSCKQDTLSCTFDICKLGNCEHPVQSNFCLIGGTCYTSGQTSPVNTCQECKSNLANMAWSQRANGAACPGGFCQTGSCCTGCLAGTTCLAGTSSSNCGTGGKPCTTCQKGQTCSKGQCVTTGGCTDLETFDSGGWSSFWTTKSGGAGTVSSAAAHDGKYGIIDPGWRYQVAHTVGSAGHKLTAWTRYASSSKGRTYLGFNASASGAYSFIFAPNTSNLLFQKNSGYGYANIASTSLSASANTWYLMQVEFLSGGVVRGTLFASNGTTVVKSLTHTIGGSLSGGVALRSFNTHHTDTIRICK